MQHNELKNSNEMDATGAAASAAGEPPKAATSVPSAPPPADAVFRPNPNNNVNPHQPPHPPPPHPHPHHPPHAPLYHAYPPPFGGGGPYSAAMGKPGSAVANQYHARRPPPSSRPQPPAVPGQPPQAVVQVGSHLSSPRHSYDREDQQHYHRPIPVRAHPNEADYRGHPPPPPPPTGSYTAAHYGALPEDRRWMGPEATAGPPSHTFPAYDGQRYSKPPLATQSFPPPPPPPPPPVAAGHMPYHYPHLVYPGNRLEEKARSRAQQPSSSGETYNDVDGREGATSPSQIEMSHRDEVTNMGCTCKKTKCLKLYCQCFAVKIYCGPNCRCLVCFNTTKHEQARKDAMRSILTRNPTAFDTKFSKTKERKTKEQQLVLAHKLGCKCRKSACMKKYCECYAGNVKCSAACRCLGCKNTPSNNFGPGKPDSNLPIRDRGMVGYDMPMAHGARTGREPWMMNAAQNLAFLKHGSPTVEKSTAHIQLEAGEVASMPSLAASSSDTSPEEKVDDTSKRAPENDGDPNGSNVNSLLIAAMAMTEFQSRNTTKESQSSQKDGGSDVETKVEVPEQKDNAEVRKVFRPSPKRKSSERAEEEAAIAAGTQAPGTGEEEASDSNDNSQCGGSGKAGSEAVDARTPLDPRDLKRTRLGSVRKKMTWEKGEEDVKVVDSPDSLLREKTPHLETPNQKTSCADALTPVSARCIDFKKIHLSSSSPLSSMNEKDS